MKEENESKKYEGWKLSIGTTALVLFVMFFGLAIFIFQLQPSAFINFTLEEVAQVTFSCILGIMAILAIGIIPDDYFELLKAKLFPKTEVN